LVSSSTITIDIDPMIHIGPVTLAWHGITIALGILSAVSPPVVTRANSSSQPTRCTRSE
jgi:prolipoprotein diacylglyceryltransferase